MDTRTKILTAAAALEGAARWARPLTLVTGYFDVLRAEHVRELRQARDRSGALTLVVAVLPLERELLPQRARAELVAGLRMVDYVLTLDPEALAGLIPACSPVEIVHLEAADTRRARQLMEHAHRRQTS